MAGTRVNLEDHLQQKELAQKKMKDDKKRAAESDDLLYITFDLQQLQPLPRISTSIAFYLRKLGFIMLAFMLLKMTLLGEAICLLG